MMISGFQPSVEVVDSALLFGHNRRDDLLDLLISKLLVGANTQIIGERRIGKTSLLKCVQSEVQERTSNILPIYLNYRQHGQIKGYADAYRLLLAYIHAIVVNKLDEETTTKLCEKFGFEQSSDPKQVFGLLEAATITEVERYIEQYIVWLNDRGFGIVLLFDEYESMMTSTFEGVAGSFFFIRDLSAKAPSNDIGVKPLTYVIAGSMQWGKLCNQFGSPEFNNTSEIIYVSPIDGCSFNSMWNYCLVNSSDLIRERVENLIPDPSVVYELTGGWPFFGKIIGQFAATEGNIKVDEIYELLRQHFDVSWSRILSDAQDVAFTNEKFQKPSVIRDLRKRGLIYQDQSDKSITPRGKLWSKYVTEQIDNRNVRIHQKIISREDEFQNKIELIGSEVVDLVMNINETCSNQKREMIFQPTNYDYKIYQALRTPTRDRNAFSFFAANTYLLIFERTISIDNKNRSTRLGRLPINFQKTHPLVQEVDAIRHEYGNAHLTQVDSWKPGKDAIRVADVLQKYFGSPKAPSNSQFLQLQNELLISLKNYLEDLNRYIQKA